VKVRLLSLAPIFLEAEFMCGRFSIYSLVQRLGDYFAIDEMVGDVLHRYNVTPSHKVPVIINNAGKRRLGSLRWGLIPHWAKDESVGYKMINARSETLHEKPSFREAFKKRRCTVLADSFFEWKTEGKEKRPYLIRLKEDKPMAFAGIWESWNSPENEKINTVSIVTTEANSLMKDVHHRMPVILGEKSLARWLEGPYDEEELLRLLEPFDEDKMQIYEVSPEVNKVANDSEELLKPVS
jgi:putative SOS response-associated peptidase YedK